MIIILYAVLLIISIFATVFLDSFFCALIGCTTTFLILVLVYREENKYVTLPLFTMIFIILDVVYHYSTGTNMLIALVCLLLLELIRKLFSLYSGLVLYIVQGIIFYLYYTLIRVIPQLFTIGSVGYLTKDVLLPSIWKTIFSIIIVFIVNILTAKVRNRGNNSRFQLK